MHVPSADELAAIAAAYAAVTAHGEPSAPAKMAEMSRWRLAGRLPELDDERVRFAARSASRWSSAGRLDG